MSKKIRLQKNREAVSAVIGVVLMVAVAIAMGAVAYAYFTGMIGESTDPAPAISFIPSPSAKSLTVSTADPDINWATIEITCTDGAGGSQTITKTGIIVAGDVINLRTDQTLTGTITVNFRHVPTNTLLSDSFIFENV